MKQPPEQHGINLARIFLKVIIILLIINFGWIAVPDQFIGQLSLYNTLIKGRERFPFGENPQLANNLSLFNFDAMFSSHKINNDNGEDAYKVILIGDSSIWGFLQTPQQTLAGIMDRGFSEQGISIINLGYPSISVLKDLQIIEYAMRYEPDLVIWFTTLEALPIGQQMETPINQNNLENINFLVEKYGLEMIEGKRQDPLQRTFWAQRRNIFDVLRLQLYGLLWDATGIDQEYPESYREAQRDFPDTDLSYYGFPDAQNLKDHLAFEVILKGILKNSSTDFILINEPILISEGENSNLRYNYYYPRWAFDAYREWMQRYTSENDIKYYDLWDVIPESEFTNSAIHLTPAGEGMLAEHIMNIITTHMGESDRNVQ